jgi:hypothetical protein
MLPSETPDDILALLVGDGRPNPLQFLGPHKTILPTLQRRLDLMNEHTPDFADSPDSLSIGIHAGCNCRPTAADRFYKAPAINDLLTLSALILINRPVPSRTIVSV